MRNRLFPNTIQRKLLLLMLVTGLLPAGAAVVHLYWGTVVGVDAVLGQFLQERAEAAAAEADAAIARRLTAFDQVRADWPRPSAAIAAAGDDAAGRFDEIVETDSDGLVRTEDPSTGRSATGPTAAARRVQLPAPVKQRPEGPRRAVFIHEDAGPGDSESRLVFIAPLPGSGERLLVASVAARRLFGPSGPESRVAGEAASIQSSRGLAVSGPIMERRLIDAYTKRMGGPVEILSGYAVVQPEDPAKPAPGVADSGTASAAPRAPERTLVGFAASKLLRAKRNDGAASVAWTAVARMDAQDVSALFGFLLWRSLFFGLLLAPVLVGLSFWLARRFLKPIRQLQRQADRLAGGDLSARVEVATGDELEDLADAFNEMAQGLDFSQAALEEQVENVRGKARQLALVNDIANAMLSAFDMPRLVDITFGRIAPLMPCDALTAVIFSTDGDSRADHSTAVISKRAKAARADAPAIRTPSPDDDLTAPGGAAGTGAALHHAGIHGGALATTDGARARRLCEVWLATADPAAGPPPAGSPVAAGLAQACVLPLRAGHVLTGALVLGRRDARPFAEVELAAMAQVVQILALAVRHIGLYDRTRHFATLLEAKVAERAQQLRRAQDQLVQAERFAATGRLAAGIAHEINNPLGIVKNYLRILKVQLAGGVGGLAGVATPKPEAAAAVQDALTVANEELDRIARIVRNLLDFYRPSADRRHSYDLNEEVQALLPLVDAGLRRKNVRLRTELSPELPLLVGDPDHIRQVLLNLLKNAEDAVAEGGRIRLTTRHEPAAPPRPGDNDTGADIPLPTQPGWIVLQVADDGCGIPEADLPNVFEPFFTTKAKMQGTGLGLAVTYGIVNNLRGTIEVESQPGRGTLFTVKLPAAA